MPSIHTKTYKIADQNASALEWIRAQSGCRSSTDTLARMIEWVSADPSALIAFRNRVQGNAVASR